MLKKVNQFSVAASLLLLGTSAAHAAVDASILTAITTAGTDAATVGAAVLVVLVAIKAFKFIRRAM